MKPFITALATGMLALQGCGNSTDNAITQTDSSRVLSHVKADDEIFSEFELDSIYKYLQTTPIVTFPKGWEKLTETNKELIIEIPGNGENSRFFIKDDGAGFFLHSLSIHDVTVDLIVDFTIVDDLISFTTIQWNTENKLTEWFPDATYNKLSFTFADETKNLIFGEYQLQTSYFTDSTFIKNYRMVELPSPYDDFTEDYPTENVIVPAEPLPIEEAVCESAACDGAE